LPQFISSTLHRQARSRHPSKDFVCLVALAHIAHRTASPRANTTTSVQDQPIEESSIEDLCALSPSHTLSTELLHREQTSFPSIQFVNRRKHHRHICVPGFQRTHQKPSLPHQGQKRNHTFGNSSKALSAPYRPRISPDTIRQNALRHPPSRAFPPTFMLKIENSSLRSGG
jgi:hypothetical protein